MKMFEKSFLFTTLPSKLKSRNKTEQKLLAKTKENLSFAFFCFHSLSFAFIHEANEWEAKTRIATACRRHPLDPVAVQ